MIELAVGSGRLAVPLAAAGHRVVGVDRDPAMLARGRRRAATAGAATAGAAGRADERLTWLEADLIDVDRAWPAIAGPDMPGGPGAFGLAILAIGSIMLLPDADRQRAAVATMARLLAPDGVAVVDAWLLGPEELASYDGSVSLEWTRTDPETGSTVTKLATGFHEAGDDHLALTTMFDERRAGQPVVRWVRDDALRLVDAAELVGFVTDAGLQVEAVAGDPGMRPFEVGDDRVVIVARRGPRA